MLLSIVITTFNRASVLKELLHSLAMQTDQDFQVVVAIDGGTDKTEEMLAALKPRYDLKWVNTHCKKYGLAVARNRGILAADGEAVVIVDDDCFPAPEFVAAHKRSVKERVITAGPRAPSDASEKRQAWKMLELGKLPNCMPISFSELDRNWPNAIITECNICMFKSDLIELGLFSERLKKYGFIGQEFFARARFLGYLCQYNSEAKITHCRQTVGDNGLSTRRRRIDIMISTALLPSFKKPREYDAQIQWAKHLSDSRSNGDILPPFPITALVAFPYRFVRNRIGDVRRHLRKKMRLHSGTRISG